MTEERRLYRPRDQREHAGRGLVAHTVWAFAGRHPC